jgi:sigma-B regulation protein RsbU (phosphoserine phosphatase)
MTSDSIPVRLRTFARQQPLYLMTAMGVAAIFWAITGSAPSLGVTLIYSFALGNLVAITLETIPPPRGVKSYAGRAVFAVVLLLVATPVIVAISTVIVFVATAEPPRGDFWVYLASGWKFPSVATLIFGGGYVLYKVNRDRLEKRNLELQTAILLDRQARTSDAAELQQAREIQQNLLPKKVPQVAGFEIAGAWEPAKVVGGDYYDVIALSETKLGLCIADVSGKGISAALLMANVQAAVRAFATESAPPSEICGRLNSVLCTNTATDKFVTLFYGVLDAKAGTLQFTNAGHLCPVVIGSDGRVVRLENNGALLGVFPDWKYEVAAVQLASGDTLVLFTDGITEAANEQGEEFGEERLIESLARLRRSGSEELQSQLLMHVKQFCNRALADDATLIVVSANSFSAEPVSETDDQEQLLYSGVKND